MYRLILLLQLSNVLSAQTSKIEVLLLGTVHFGQSSDLVSSGIADIGTPKRQRELNEVIRKLAVYNPQKIFVENTPQSQAYWDEVYNRYLMGEVPLNNAVVQTEIFQIGIKLAAFLKLKEGVSCVNFDINEPVNGQEPFALYARELQKTKPSYEQLFKQNPIALHKLNEVVGRNEEWKKLSLRNHLLKLNHPQNLADLKYVNVMAYLDNTSNTHSADFAGVEYYRNLKIIQQIYGHLNANSRKVLVIVGAGHVAVLKEMMSSHPLLKVVELEPWLK